MNKFLLVVVCCTLCSSFLFSQKYDNVTIKTDDLGNGIYMLTGAGGNIGVSAGEDGVFIIDDQYAPLHEKIINAIHKISSKPIRFVINTHWHFDHTGGNELMGKKGSVIIAHDNVRRMMSASQAISFFQMSFPASPKEALPIVTFNDSLTLHFNGDIVKALHVANAHTDGDAIVYFEKANIMHMGDIFFKGQYPFIDPEHGGSIVGVINAINIALKIINKDTKIIPGHGSLATIKDLIDYRDILQIIEKRLRKLINEGFSLEEIIKRNPLADLNDVWGQGFMKPELFTKIIFSNLSQENKENKNARK